MKWLMIISLVSLFTTSFCQSTELIKGLYLSSTEYIENNPAGTDQFYTKMTARTESKWTGTSSIELRLESTDRKITNVWGFAEGNTAYIRHEDDYFPLFHRNDSMLFYGYDIVTKEDWYTGEMQNPIDAKRARLNAKKDAKTKKILFYISKDDGSSHPAMKVDSEESDQTMELIIYRPFKKESDSIFSITINDSNPTICNVGSYFSYLISPETHGAAVCLLGEEYNCIDAPFKPSKTQYVQVSHQNGKNTVKMKLVDTDEGEWFIQSIDNQIRKQDKQ